MIPSLNSQLCLNVTVLLLCGSSFVKQINMNPHLLFPIFGRQLLIWKKAFISKQGSMHNVFVQLLLINQLCIAHTFIALPHPNCTGKLHWLLVQGAGF